jgi:hypothetical protein
MARQRIRDDRAVIAAAAVRHGPGPFEPTARARARRIGARVQMLGGTPVRVLADSDPGAALPGDAATITQSLPTAAGPVDVVARKPLQDTHAADGVVRQALPLAAVVGLLVAAAVGLALATRLLGRVRRLRDGPSGSPPGVWPIRCPRTPAAMSWASCHVRWSRCVRSWRATRERARRSWRPRRMSCAPR